MHNRAHQTKHINSGVSSARSVLTLPPSDPWTQVLRYKNGQKYDAHWDWFEAADMEKDSATGQRTATVLMYLSGEAFLRS